MGNLAQDLQNTWQTVRRNPGFVVAMIAILGLGAGVNTAIFSVVYGIVLRPLPFTSPDQLYFISSTQSDQNHSRIKTSGPDYDDFRDQNHSFPQIAAVLPYFTETLVREAEPQVLRCTAVSSEFFPLLGIRPLLGRVFRPEEYHPDGTSEVTSYNVNRKGRNLG